MGVVHPAVAATENTGSENERLIQVLDHGFVELIDALGSDLTVVNSARVSFGKRKTEMDEKDEKLVKFLAKHKHWSPFRHVQLQFHCKVPEFVARQWYKHVVGIAYTDSATVDHAWNEISLRYVDAGDFDYYTPQGFRTQSPSNKQASTDEHVPDGDGLIEKAYKEQSDNAFKLYNELVEKGVAKEQARGLLPLNIYTEFYWTVSLQALVNFIHLRKHAGAQYEIREYADALEKLTQLVVPVAFDALFDVE